MVAVGVGPGDDVEAWCTRCRMNLNHRVVAVVGREIRKVQCLTCGGDHKYHPPKRAELDYEPKAVRPRASSPASVEKTGKSVPKSAARASGEWSTVMKEMPEGTVPRLYKIAESFGPSEFIEHPVFGVGRVLDVLGAQRIQVIFKEGRKVLVCNKPS